MTDEIEPLDPSLAAESAAFLAQMDRVLELETLKRQTPTDDPALPALAREVEEAVRGLLDRAGQQRIEAVATHADVVATGSPGEAIVDVPADLSMADVLAKWRESERELSTADPGSERAEHLRQASFAYRLAYQRLYEAHKK